MTLSALQDDLIIFGVFLIIGFILREWIKPLQKLFLPASVIGGVVALVSGQQLLGWVNIPESFSSFSGVLINLVMTTLIFGITMNTKRLKSYMDYSAISLGIYGVQSALGIIIGSLLLIFWPMMPQGWGVMGVFSFYGGHGTAGATGAVFEELGVAGNLGIGMILATIGLMVAIVVGMIIINIGVRKGWTQYIDRPKSRPDWFYGGTLPKEQQKSIGTEKVTSISINGLAFQLALIFVAMFIGGMLFKGLTNFFPFFGNIPSLIYGMTGALIIWPIMVRLKLDRYVDKKTMNSIAGLALELIILTALATLNIKLAATFFVPIMIYSIILIAVTIFMSLYLCKKFCSSEWFEKAIMIFGAKTGNTSVGLALLRMVDPDLKSNVAEAHGVYSGVTFWINFLPAIMPPLILAGIGIPLGISLIMGIGSLVLLWIFFGRKRKTVNSSRKVG